jgi:DNA-binding response OmpR family regulator
MEIVLLANDLMVVSHVQSAAARIGANVRMATTAAEAQRICNEDGAGILLIDLAMPGLDLEFARTMKEASVSPRIVAFGPHVHKERLAAAREVGCDLVTSRGEFFSQIDTILQNAAN